MRLLAAICLAGCGFQPVNGNALGGDAGTDGRVDGMVDAVHLLVDAPICWPFTPTNFDACGLPTGSALSATSNYDLDTDTTMLPHMVQTQSDGSTVTVVHLTSLTIASFVTMTVHGSHPLILAIDGSATISGTIATTAGADDATRCATRAGSPGTASTGNDNGGGGGGGGAGADVGGVGTDGSDDNNMALHGTGGPAGMKLDGLTSLSPLVAGCGGATGGKTNTNNGSPGGGGNGGGAIEISAQTQIALSGTINAAGQGGGGAGAMTGGGGGGSGGGILLESPIVEIAGIVCADGGAGGEGGGNPNAGDGGGNGSCTGASGATTGLGDSFGGTGGGGGWKNSTFGGDAGASNTNGGGGGGGGAVGWIRFRAVGSTPGISGIVTPTPRTS